MRRIRQWQLRLLRSRGLAVLVICLTLLVLAGTIYVARLSLRSAIREQIARRDGEVLYNVIQTLQTGDAAASEMAGSIEEPGEQFNVILKASRIKGVLAVRLFTPDGQFTTGLPADVAEMRLAPADLEALQSLKPLCRFRAQAQVSDEFMTLDARYNTRIPLLEITIPLHAPETKRLAGVAQFLLEGQSLAAEYATLDRNLAWQALIAFLGGGGVLVLALGWAFRRLAERTANLQKANQELALAARTSAVGAMAAHLIHGLKNPLAGLQSFVASRDGQDGQADPDWAQAIASTRRMQNLINEVIAVLREEQHGHTYELTLAEFGAVLSERVTPLAREQGVELSMELKGERSLCSRSANLMNLILVNLLLNAIQASAPGKRVQLKLTADKEGLTCEVVDEGSGLPPEVAGNLFAPCASSKQGGSGIGLAISKQLAHHLGAQLELKSSTPQGCAFVLILPAQALAGPTNTIPSRAA